MFLEVYELVKNFPKDEVYGLSAQIKRAASSIPANIAEGFNRFHSAEYKQFLFIAYGSCAELETHLEIACDPGFINLIQKGRLLEKLDHEERMIRNLIKKLQASLKRDTCLPAGRARYAKRDTLWH